MKNSHFKTNLALSLIAAVFFKIQVGFADVDTETLSPTLLSPTASSSNIATLQIQYTLPEAALANSVSISFVQGASTVASLTMDTSTSVNITIDPFTNPIINGHVLSFSGIPISSGTYTVVLSYQDASANPAASATSSNVLISLTAPTPEPSATASPTPTPCVSSVALPRVKVKKRSATITISGRKNVNYTIRAVPIGTPSRRSKAIKFNSTQKRRYLVTFLNLKAGLWGFYYSAKSNAGAALSCTVEKTIT